MLYANSIKNYAFSKISNYICSLKRNIEIEKNKIHLQKARKNYKPSKDPLVSVLIPTYNRAKILTERTLPSVLRQTYQNFEIIVVGDHCQDNTPKLIDRLDDDRINFYNLPTRGKYPEDPRYRWWVAGVVPANKAISISSGEWIAPLDDDDEFSHDHIEVLLNHALENNYEMVYGKVSMEVQPNKWQDLGSYPLECDNISRMSALYNSTLNFIKYDINCWKCNEPADWNMWRRMKDAGVRIGFINKVVGKHYLEGTQHNLNQKN